MRKLKNRRKFIGLITIIFLLLIGSVVFSLLQSDDSYRYFTGMGSSFDLAPDEEHYLFSYYLDGEENIYRSNADGTEIEKLTESTSERFHSPRYSNDGSQFLFLAQNAERINTLYLANQDGGEQQILTTDQSHVSEAAFSDTGEEIYFIGSPADDFNKAEGETTEGYDLFVIDIASGDMEQLTNQDHFSMNFLSVSQDGKEVYYSLYDGSREKVTAFSLDDGIEKGAPSSYMLPEDTYSFRYSPDGSRIAYTTISKESRDSSLYEYELFLFDLEKEDTKRLTDLDSSVVSPRFYKNQNQIAFLENTNWPQDPEEHALHVMDLETEKIHLVELDLPDSEASHWLSKTMDTFANGNTMAILYVVLLGLISTYLAFFHSKRKRRYIPAIASLLLAVLVFISSFIVAFVVNPWYGIGLGMLAAALFGCTLIVFVYVFTLNFFLKRN